MSRSNRPRDRPTYYFCCRCHAHWPCLIKFKKECHAPNDWREMTPVLRAIVYSSYSTSYSTFETGCRIGIRYFFQNWVLECRIGMQNAELSVGFNGQRFTHRNWDIFFYTQRPTVYASPKERICGHAIGSFWSRRPSRSWRSFRGLHISRRVTSCVLACVSWNLWSRIYDFVFFGDQ